MTHVDEFIDGHVVGADDPGVVYARFVLNFMRLPATLQNAFRPYTSTFRLFCTYGGQRWRVTGASRLGDIWLNENFDAEGGYDERVDVALCTNWGPAP